MSRPAPLEPRVQIQIRIPESLKERLEREADERDLSMNYIANRAISLYLEMMTPVDRAVLRHIDQEGTT